MKSFFTLLLIPFASLSFASSHDLKGKLAKEKFEELESRAFGENLEMRNIILSEKWAEGREETRIYSSETNESCTKSFEKNQEGLIIDSYYCDKNNESDEYGWSTPYVEDIF